MKSLIENSLQAHLEIFNNIRNDLISDIDKCAQCMINTINSGGTIYWCGNGGSASDAEHLCAELVGRFDKDRRSLSSISLTANTSVITSIGNDFGNDEIFSRQVEGLVTKNDLLVGISTSGNSRNVERAIVKAKGIGCKTVGLLGRDGGSLGSVCDVILNVGGVDTARIQEMHILIGHILCESIETSIVNSSI
ncbi:Phosphoheptose isomerase 1 [hydrothermal vent metagenome]|uniref:D-sedoheptulose-7-phosphate isomerase n=1 Tax=hydrothermal vent metagenome TaxID=652676 RepID=A0A3B0Z4Q3_9ZZZZ